MRRSLPGSPGWPKSFFKTTSKPAPPQQHQSRAPSGPDTWILPGGATSSQLQGATMAGQQQSEQTEDAPSTAPQPPHETVTAERSSDWTPGEYHALPPLSQRVAPAQPPSWPPDGPSMTAQPPPVTPNLPLPSWFPDGQPSPRSLSRVSSLWRSLARLLAPEPTVEQRQPTLTVVPQEPSAGHPSSEQTAPVNAIPPRVPPTTPGPPEVTSHGAQSVDVEVARSASAVRFGKHEENVALYRNPELVANGSGTLSSVPAQDVSGGLQRAETAGTSTAAFTGDVMSADAVEQGTSAQRRRRERKRALSVSIIPNIFGTGPDVTATDAGATGQLDTGVTLTWVRETNARAVLFTILHCLSQALVNILIKQVVDIPKTKIAYYVAFGFMLGNMPEAFSLPDPFGPRHVQVDLGLRGMASLMSLILKAEALRYLMVSDLAVANTLVPVCVMVLSWYFLGEGMGLAMWTSVSLCLCGIVIVMRPAIFFKEWDAETTQTRLIGFMYAFGSAVSLVIMIVLLRLTRNATNRFLGFNSGLTRTVLALSMAIAIGEFDQLLDGRFLATLVMMGKLSFCTVYFLGKALQSQSGAFVTTIKFSGDIIFSVVLQVAFMDLYPDLWTLGGIALLVLSFVMIACGNIIVPSSWRGRRHQRPSRLRVPPLKSVEDEAVASPSAPPSTASQLFSVTASAPTPAN